MSVIKKNIKNWVYLLGKKLSTKTLIQFTKKRLIVPVYHLISDENIPHIKHLYEVKSVKQFEADLDYLLQFYKPIDFADFQKRLLKGGKVQENEFILTFDDGLSEFHDVIAPILLKKGIPAICFLNSDFVDNKDLFFRYKASLLIEEISQKPEILKQKEIYTFLENLEIGGSTHFKKALLKVSYSNKNVLDELALLLNYSFEKYLQEHKPYLTSSQIESLIQQGFYFGSHSCDHPEYQFIDLKEQIRQTQKSTDFVAEKFNLTYKTFAFPFTDFGVSKEYFEQVNVKDKVVDVSFGCAGIKKDSYKNHFQRIPFEQKHKSAKEILNSEYVYYILKSSVNKNKISRK